MNTTQSVSRDDGRSTAPARQAQYNVAAGYLRAFIVALVVAHHAFLAYNPYASGPPSSLLAKPRLWQAFPVVDPQKSTALSVVVGFNDIFFMSLMFFLSGLFVWSSLNRKGPGTFLRDRALRLGVPFLMAAAIVAPLAYYPAYLQSGAHGGVIGYVRVWFALGDWPAGPAWFVWVLLVFDSVAALLYRIAPGFGSALARFASRASQHPFAFFVQLTAITAVAYVPMRLIFGPFDWFAFGPFFFQKDRALHYLIYFFAGIAVGAFGLERGLLASDGNLARRWWLWAIRTPIAFLCAIAVGIAAIAPQNARHIYVWGSIAAVLWAISCAVSGFAFLAVFARFARRTVRWFDSLRDNSYGIYLIHYAFVSWVQYAMLRSAMPAVLKGLAVFAGALALSWITVAALRKVRVVGKVI